MVKIQLGALPLFSVNRLLADDPIQQPLWTSWNQFPDMRLLDSGVYLARLFPRVVGCEQGQSIGLCDQQGWLDARCLANRKLTLSSQDPF